MTKGTLSALMAGFVVFVGTVWAEVPAPGKLVIKNVRVFDGLRVIPNAAVVIDAGKVIAVGPASGIPRDARVIDASGQTLLPGLIDAHVHVWDRSGLRQAAMFGVTGVVDMFTSVDFASGIKREQSTGPVRPALAFLVSSMTLVTVEGGHGTEYGLKIPTLSGPAQAQAFVDARLAEGSDFIKIIYDDGRAYGQRIPTLSLDELKAVIKAAHARHKLAVVHAATLKMCREALEAGADGLAHLNFDEAFDPGLGRLAASRKAFIIPTFSVLSAMNGKPDPTGLARDSRLAPYLKPVDVRNLKLAPPFKTAPGAYTAAETVFKGLLQAGVPILAGTDAMNPGTIYGASLHGELELLVKAGLTPVEALKGGTSLPADMFAMGGRGHIRPGSPADLVLVEGDPTTDITATRAIVGVWIDGVRLDREAYLKEAAAEREAAEQQRNAPAPPGLGDGTISDFESGKIAANFGAGWVLSTDAIRGGKSKAELSVVDGGAEGSSKALLIKGVVADVGPAKWAGAMFLPGPTMMAPANLSSKKAVSFWAKGNGKSFSVMLFAQSSGFMPMTQRLTLGPEWKEYVFPFVDFGTDAHDLMGILICASDEPGEFAFQIDNVRLR